MTLSRIGVTRLELEMRVMVLLMVVVVVMVRAMVTMVVVAMVTTVVVVMVTMRVMVVMTAIAYCSFALSKRYTRSSVCTVSFNSCSPPGEVLLLSLFTDEETEVPNGQGLVRALR